MGPAAPESDQGPNWEARSLRGGSLDAFGILAIPCFCRSVFSSNRFVSGYGRRRPLSRRRRSARVRPLASDLLFFSPPAPPFMLRFATTRLTTASFCTTVSFCSLVFGLLLMGFGGPEARAQSRQGQAAPAPSGGQAPARTGRMGRSGPVGAEVPSAARPSNLSRMEGPEGVWKRKGRGALPL